jgi:hypothetical protein
VGKIENSDLRIVNSGEETLNSIFSTLNFPKEAYLHKRIAKKMFLENASLGASDKKLFRENVKSVYWEYTLKPSTCPVLPYRDKEREYLEVAILQVKMKSQKGHKRIAEIIHRIIPYPLFLVFQKSELREVETGELRMGNEKDNSQLTTLNSQFALSIAPKRFSQVEPGAFVAERFYTTCWMNIEMENEELKIENLNKLSTLNSQFITSLAWSNMPLQTYGTLYNAWMDRFTGYECSMLSGNFTIGKAGDRLDRLTRCREIESRISELRGQLKKAAFNSQVELNIQIKKFEQELKQLAGEL